MGVTKVEAEVVFINGEVITVDQKNTVTEAVAVKDNHIIFVGLNSEVNSFIGEKNECHRFARKNTSSWIYRFSYSLNVLWIESVGDKL